MDTAIIATRQALEPANLIPTTTVSALIKSGADGREVCTTVADAKASLEEWLADHPDDYGALVVLGEINLRVGLVVQARDLLYKASLQQPPSWEAFTRTGALLRRAEELAEKAFLPFAGFPPPLFLRRLARRATEAFPKLKLGRASN